MTPLYNGMLPPSLVGRLADIWPGGKHVVTEYGEKFPDRSVWAEARAHGYTIITKDSDFSDAEKYAGPPGHLIWAQSCPAARCSLRSCACGSSRSRVLAT
jgi:predicted nuclease of predicted toxin-antitoxin system